MKQPESIEDARRKVAHLVAAELHKLQRGSNLWVRDAAKEFTTAIATPLASQLDGKAPTS
jgi:hypothetical protein